MRSRLAVLVSGSGSNLQAVLDACASGRIAADVVLVVSNRRDAYALERAADVGVATAYHPLKAFRDAGRTRVDYDAALADVVAAARPDWVVMAGWMHVLSPAFLDRFPARVVNLHPALPGAFPGAHAIEGALAAHQRGEIECTGAMVHLVPDAGVDDGPVLATAEVPIVAGDTVDALAARIHHVEHALLVDVLAGLVDGCLVPSSPVLPALPPSSPSLSPTPRPGGNP